MRKIKFDIGGIVIGSKSKIRSTVQVNCGKKFVIRAVIGCAGLFALSSLSVLGGGIIQNTFSSVLGAFGEINNTKTIEKPQTNFDNNLTFSFEEAPIKYVIPNAKIDNALSFKIGNLKEDFKLKSITFTVGEDACNSIKRAYLSEESFNEINYAKCEDGLLKINSLNRNIKAGQASKFTLTVSLNDTAKVGQHLNFFINNPRDIEAVIGSNKIYVPFSYPINVSTMYVVGLKYAL